MRNLIIVGAGGFGRELIQWINDINRVNPIWNVIGFLDDTDDPLAGKKCPYSVIGTIKDWEIKKNQYYAIAIANPKNKETVVNYLEQLGAEFVSIIHPSAKIADNALLGKGLIVYPDAKIGPDTRIGNYVTLLSSSIGHDAIVGDYTTISSCCDITGGVKLGKRAFLASHSTIVPKLIIGDDAYVGAGSVVLKNIKPGVKVFGNPAKIMEF